MQYNHHRSHACTLLCTALALAFGCAAAHAADVKISGSVITVSISIKSKALITAISKWAVRVNCLMIRI